MAMLERGKAEANVQDGNWHRWSPDFGKLQKAQLPEIGRWM
jgi:hypothetical protein